VTEAMLFRCPLCPIAVETREAFEEHCAKTHPSDLWIALTVKPEINLLSGTEGRRDNAGTAAKSSTDTTQD
jgi:hypothetical protein